jgi:hypothetical protein
MEKSDFILRPLYPQGKSLPYPLEGWMGPRAGLDAVKIIMIIKQ